MTRIDGLNTGAASRAFQGGAAPDVDSGQHGSSAGSAVEGAGSGRQDAVVVSDRARVMALAARSVSDAPGVRVDKVASLKTAIANGSYTVDAQGIAARLLRGGTLG
ncbi:MAG: flagellar biosynthesis anti-sigma factor FlgM [Dehalococcoidia bacterium]